MTTPVEVKRTPEIILGEIEDKLASVDGIATSDAFRIGGLVREYGNACAGKASADIIVPLLDGLMKPPKAPWENDR